MDESYQVTDGNENELKLEQSRMSDKNDDGFEEMNEFIEFKKLKEKNHFISRISKKLKDYINTSNKKYLLFIILIICIIASICLIIIAFLLPVSTSSNTTKTNLIWYQNEIIYEINVPKFRDSNQDGIGDLQGIVEKLDYLEKNNIRSILLQSSIFNISDELFELSNRQYAKIQTTDLFKLDPQIGDEDDFYNFMKILADKNMHLIIDLPLSSTSDHRDLSWYGYNTSSSIKIEKPCLRNKNDLGCNYYNGYKRIPLDFSNQEIIDEAESRLRYWLLEQNIDGIRVDLPLEFNRLNNTYSISLKTINQWKMIVKEIERKTKPKLLFFDISSDLQSIITDSSLYDQITYSTTLSQFREQQRLANIWQIGPNKGVFRLGMMNAMSQRLVFTLGMLMSGTPIVLYGDELGIKQKYDSWMPWTSDPPYGGFASCLSEKCNERLSSYDVDFLQTNVKSQEANLDIDNESLLIFFRRLSKLRQDESFQNGVLKRGYESTSDIGWFIREAPGYRGFLIVFVFDRFKKEAMYISLQNLTNQQIPKQIYYEYQWPRQHVSSINTDRLMIYPGSINIFSWPSKTV